MTGFDEGFIGLNVPLPQFSQQLEGVVLRRDEGLRRGVYRDYANYSLAIDQMRRAPIVVAANINQSQLKDVRRGPWKIDTGIGGENQLDNDYYRHNRWDRGHMARRASAAWGESEREAKAASDATMYYTNACLQWDAFNQDEWLALEEWVRTLDEDDNDRLSVFSGPIYGEEPIFVRPSHRDPAEVPAGFFKIVCFRHRDSADELSVRAFVAYQDVEAKKDWKGKNRRSVQFYQCTVMEIEELTGLIFHEQIAEKNPLFYVIRNDEALRRSIPSLPENIPVDQDVDIVDPDQTRNDRSLEDADIFISGALVDPVGQDRGQEWVSIVNLQSQPVQLANWTLTDNAGSAMLSGELAPGEALRLQGDGLGSIQLGNTGDVLTLMDDTGRWIDRVQYWQEDVRPGRAVVFPQDLRSRRFTLLTVERPPRADAEVD